MSAKLFHDMDWEKVAFQARFRPRDIAAKCEVSLRHLERHFAAQFQKTPKQWARQLRFRLAIDLMRSGLSIKQVAAKLGYSDSAHLCNEFRRVWGVSPRQYVDGMTTALDSHRR